MLFLEAKGECTLDVICYTECMWNGKDNLVVVQINWDGQFQDLCLAHSIYCEWLALMTAEFQEFQISLGDLLPRSGLLRFRVPPARLSDVGIEHI